MKYYWDVTPSISTKNRVENIKSSPNSKDMTEPLETILKDKDPDRQKLGDESSCCTAIKTQKDEHLHAHLEGLLGDTEFGLFLVDDEEKVIWINHTLERFFGVTEEEIIGQDSIQVITEKLAPLVKNPDQLTKALIESRRKGTTLTGLDCLVLGFDNVEERWLEVSSRPVQHGVSSGGRVELYTDVTGLKYTEQALQESERCFQQLAEFLPEAVFEMSLDGTLVYANSNGLSYFGFSKEDLEKGLNGLSLIHISDQPRLKSDINRLLKGKKTGVNEYKAIRKDGSIFPVWISSTVMKHHGKAMGFRGVIIDSERQKQNTAEFEMLKTVVEQVSDSIEITDSDGNMQYVNQAFEKATGYSREEAIGKNPRILKSGRHPLEYYSTLWKTIKSGKKWRGRLTNRKKNGELISEDTSISTVYNQKGKITNFVAIKRDVTDEAKKEEKMRLIQKMEAVATLSGGIAHDFNNILAGVMGYTELSLKNLPEDNIVHGNLSEVMKACNRAKKLIGQILQFSRSEEAESKPHNIDMVIEDALGLLRSTLPTTIEIHKHIESKALVAIEPTQMHQIIMNICTNAFYAMENNDAGGRLDISLSDVEMSLEDALDAMDLNPGPHVRLSISDNGTGMDAATVEKIFDPYFTTKEKDKGTGLGLSVVHGIVRNCGGAINVHSEPGVGTTFNFYFPVMGVLPSQAFAKSADLQKKGTGERILFVDDEQILAQLGIKMLEQLGYHATSRTSPTEALEVFRAKPFAFDLVITDLTMPNMTGEQLATCLMEIRKDIPVILCTGFSQRISEEKIKALGISDFLLKPVTMDDLGKAIEKALGND